MEQAPQNVEKLLGISEKLYFEKTKEIAFEISEGKLEFRVCNVGQALATSLAEYGQVPFLYFDYGLPYGKNKDTRPIDVDLPIRKGGYVFLSHIHRDHWWGLGEFPDAYRANWYIPEQSYELEFPKKMAEIRIAGGHCYRIQDLELKISKNVKIEISHSAESITSKGRTAKNKHEIGMVMRICVKKEDREFHILVAGDQDYDYVKKSFLKAVDLLVACHHGGTYSWTTYAGLPQFFSSLESTIVYSYGKNNTYGHPSKRSRYEQAGWVNFHDTVNGDYVITI